MGNQTIGCYQVARTLGKGRFGKTRLCRTADNYLNTIKIIELLPGQNKQRIVKQLKEPLKQDKNNKFIVPVKDVIDIDQNKIGIMTEYYPMGNLATSYNSKPIYQITVQMKELAKSVAVLHDTCQVPHKNIKPQNVLMFQDIFLLTDLPNFNFSSVRIRDILGTYDYQAPQAFNKANTLSSDIFSLGIIFIQMFFCERIRNLQLLGDNMRPSLTKSDYPSTSLLNSISNLDLQYLIKKMVEQSSLDRINIKQVLNLLDGIITQTKSPTSALNKEDSLITQDKLLKDQPEKQFIFTFDTKHDCYNNFQIIGNKIRRIDQIQKRYQAVSRESIPWGRWVVNVSILNYGQQNEQVVIGILSQERRREKMSGDIDQPNSISLWTNHSTRLSNLCENGVWNSTVLPVIRPKQGRLKVVVDSIDREIVWWIDGHCVATSKMPQSYWNQQHYVFVGLMGLNCQVKFGSKDPYAV